MATRKEGSSDKKSGATKSPKSAGTRSAPPRPTTARRATKTAREVASTEVVQTAVTTGGNTRAELSPEEIYKLIQETAYYKAKARGFAPGHEVQDWIEAEAEVRLRLERRT